VLLVFTVRSLCESSYKCLYKNIKTVLLLWNVSSLKESSSESLQGKFRHFPRIKTQELVWIFLQKPFGMYSGLSSCWLPGAYLNLLTKVFWYEFRQCSLFLLSGACLNCLSKFLFVWIQAVILLLVARSLYESSYLSL